MTDMRRLLRSILAGFDSITLAPRRKPRRPSGEVPDWVREASERLHREHPAPCALMTTVTGKCTCSTPPDRS